MVNLEFLKKKVWQVDGLTLTIGSIILLVVIGYLVMRARR